MDFAAVVLYNPAAPLYLILELTHDSMEVLVCILYV